MAGKSIDDINKEKEKKIEKFKSLLQNLDTVDDKKKSLWVEIYQNAVEDRESGYVLFLDLQTQVIGNISHHAVHGPVLAKYLERVSRANDQIIKLVELITDEENKEVDADEIFDKIGKS